MIIQTADVIIIVAYFFLLFLSIFWLIVLISSKQENKDRLLQRHPIFTTIIPAYNEDGSIKETIASVLALDYPHDLLEIIVVNDGSADRTPEIVKEMIKAHPLRNIRLINQKNGGKGNAMNAGLAVAKGEFFASLDADSFISPEALKKMLPYFDENKNIAAVCPLLKIKKPSSILQKVQWYEYIINMLYKDLNAQLDCIHVTPGPFSVYRTKVIQDLGGYDEKTITEDLEIAIRLQKHHYKIVQTFDATVETEPPNTWSSLFKQRIRWYKGSVDNSIAYRKLMFNKEYGDFGFIRMPTIIASGAVAIILTLTIVQQFTVRIVNSFISLKAIDFDLLTLLKNYTFNLNILGLPFFKITVALTLITLSLFITIYSFKVVRERITNHGRTWVSLLLYVSIYAFFISFVWITIAFRYATKKTTKW